MKTVLNQEGDPNRLVVKNDLVTFLRQPQPENQTGCCTIFEYRKNHTAYGRMGHLPLNDCGANSAIAWISSLVGSIATDR